MRTTGITLGEAAVGGAVLIVAAVAWSSLALATFGHHSLAAVVGATVVLLLPLVFALWPMRVRASRAEAAFLAGLAVVCLGSTLPGWFRAFGDLDPGVYLAHAAHITRTGSLAIDDPVLDPVLDLPWADAMGRLKGGTRFPGYYVQPQHPRRVVPQFFALYPSLLATAGSAFGRMSMPNVNPVIATLSVLLLFLVLQRAVGRVGAACGALLLAVNVVQVYYARFPDSEILAQALVLAAVLGLLIASRENAAVPAFVAGVMVGMTFLARPEGVVAVLLAGAGIAFALAAPGRERLWAAFGLGLVVPLPHAFVQAYHLDLCGLYSQQNALPGPGAVGLLLGSLLGGGLLLRLGRRGRATAKTWWWRGAPWVAAIALTSAWVFGMLRPLVLDPVVSARGRALWSELGVWRLALFLSPVGFGMAWIGALRACFGRWRPWRLVPLLPLAFLPLVLFQSQVANPYLIPWSRRLVVYVLPGCFFLIGSAVALGIASTRVLVRSVTGAAVAAALLWSLRLTAPVLTHVEGQGSLALIDTIGQLAPGRRSLVLFTSGSQNPSARALGGPIWSWHDQTSALLSRRAGPSEVTRFLNAFPDQPAFLVTGNPLPLAWQGVVLGLDRTLEARVPHFGLARLTPFVVDESFPVLVYRLRRAPSALEERYPDAASGKERLR